VLDGGHVESAYWSIYAVTRRGRSPS
jgi:hypothetical protein